MAANGLLFMARNRVHIRHVHELRDGLMEEDEVAQLGIMRILVLLICEPVDGIRGDT